MEAWLKEAIDKFGETVTQKTRTVNVVEDAEGNAVPTEVIDPAEVMAALAGLVLVIDKHDKEASSLVPEGGNQ